MSGGSYNYIYDRLEDECVGRMYDIELDDLVKDLCDVLHDLEWWQSCDIGEENYRDTVKKFKEKWFSGDCTERFKGYIDTYIDNQLESTRKELYRLMGLNEVEE